MDLHAEQPDRRPASAGRSELSQSGPAAMVCVDEVHLEFAGDRTDGEPGRPRRSASRTTSQTCWSCARSRSRLGWPAPGSGTSSRPRRSPIASTPCACRSRSARPQRRLALAHWPRACRGRPPSRDRGRSRAARRRSLGAVARPCPRSRTSSPSGRERVPPRRTRRSWRGRSPSVATRPGPWMAGCGPPPLDGEEDRLLSALGEVLS